MFFQYPIVYAINTDICSNDVIAVNTTENQKRTDSPIFSATPKATKRRSSVTVGLLILGSDILPIINIPSSVAPQIINETKKKV